MTSATQTDVQIAAAVAALRRGGIVLHATEAVWGLACDAGNEIAVAAVQALKQRPSDKGLIVVADDFRRVEPWLAAVAPEALAAAQATWPGPFTWIFPTAPGCPPWLVGERASLAVRISDHPQVHALTAAFGAALVSTSANRAGQPPVAHLDEVDPQIRAQVDCVLIGETGGLQRPTSVRDVRTGEWLRR